MNSAIEEVLGFKTCCGLRMFDQNLEIHLKNRGDRPIVVLSYFDLVGVCGSKRVTTLTPPGQQCIEPSEIIAFYCSMDETRWRESSAMVFYDTDGNAYRVDLEPDSAAACPR
jgi:hypothetical protein